MNEVRLVSGLSYNNLCQTITPAPACTDHIRDDFQIADVAETIFLESSLLQESHRFCSTEGIPTMRPSQQHFSSRTNTPITAWVHELYRRNHDIALHSMTHNPLTAYWASLNATMWQKEVVDQREQLSNFARVPPTAIQGLRAPFLQIGGDPMYNVLKTSVGFWTVPMLDMIGDNNAGCAMVDTCTPVPETSDATYNLLLRNFNDQYAGAEANRAPFGIYTHALDYLGTKNDVYIVGISQALEWVKNPTPLDQIPSSNLFKNPTRPNNCPTIYNCRYAPEQTPFPKKGICLFVHHVLPCTHGLEIHLEGHKSVSQSTAKIITGKQQR
ncbi:hypothetical protein Ocin01_17007 [Orchesella cincta]|uniref:Uncharacterized protein n=1 Tax=Orchesella cincta TaxID=48709 RepID=A0A1D2M9L8_ORCCI|nr:hypothetical protein Ocin01_17007 [Orchesella cincta]